MTDGRLAWALERCLAAVQRGQSVSDALRPYPRLRPELDSLLRSAIELGDSARPRLESGVRSAVRAALMDAIRRQPDRRSAPGFHIPNLSRFALVPVLIVVVFAAVLAGAMVIQPSGRSEAATVLTVLQGEVQVETPKGVVAGRNGMRIAPGDRVITRPDARAVLTFFDGSTVTLENDAVVILQSVKQEKGRLRVVLSQPQGSTWTHIPQALGPADFQIDTPSARVQTREASVATTVRNGQTDVGAESGPIEVQTEQTRREVPDGYHASVSAPGAGIDPRPLDRPARVLVLRIQGRVHAYVTDPGKATVGMIAPGVPINQVPGARVTLDGDVRIIEMPNPADGLYSLSLTATGDGLISVAAVLRNGATDHFEASVAVRQGESLAINFSLGLDDLALLGTNREPNQLPAEVVVPERAAEKAANGITPAAKPTQRPQPTKTPTPRPAATPTTKPVTPVADPVEGSQIVPADTAPRSLR